MNKGHIIHFDKLVHHMNTARVFCFSQPSREQLSIDTQFWHKHHQQVSAAHMHKCDWSGNIAVNEAVIAKETAQSQFQSANTKTSQLNGKGPHLLTYS